MLAAVEASLPSLVRWVGDGSPSVLEFARLSRLKARHLWLVRTPDELAPRHVVRVWQVDLAVALGVIQESLVGDAALELLFTVEDAQALHALHGMLDGLGLARSR